MTHEWVEKLSGILGQMESLYARVVPLLEKERLSLVEMNYERLYVELSEKDEVLSLIRKFDRERLRIQDYFLTIVGKDESDWTLRNLGEMLISHGGPDAELGARLLAQRERIETLVGQIQHRINLNENFINRSVKNIRSLAQVMATAAGEGASHEIPSHHQTYTGKAKVKKAPQKSGALVTKQL